MQGEYPNYLDLGFTLFLLHRILYVVHALLYIYHQKDVRRLFLNIFCSRFVTTPPPPSFTLRITQGRNNIARKRSVSFAYGDNKCTAFTLNVTTANLKFENSRASIR